MKIVQDVDKAIEVFRDAGEWMQISGKRISKWWDLKNLNKDFLLQYAKPEEFYVGLVENKPAVAAILQISQNGQDWESIDKGNPPRALFIHWLAVAHEFHGRNLSMEMVNFAANLAKKENCSVLRVDTNASEAKLRKIYESLGFVLVGEVKEDYRETAFYEKTVK